MKCAISLRPYSDSREKAIDYTHTHTHTHREKKLAMRLINVHSFEVEEVWDESVKEYAILSHRWEDDEVSFRDMQDLAVASTMEGFAKIQRSCDHAQKDGYSHVWVDTCCINKESSAELSEAINSMYRWYKASPVCYAFLSDVHANTDNRDVEQQIRSSVWFSRGWTLQELIAPQNVVFYDGEWEFLGTKQTLSHLLVLKTGIDEAILNGEPLSRRSIAQRMSWASERITKCVEDNAYCLLGIFDVNMPLLYGEREKAFLRLQEQIIKQSDDHTIFAWAIHRHDQPGLLADSPKAFQNCQYVRTMTSRKGRSPYSLTNRGLSIKLLATHFTTDTYIVRLDCADGLLPADAGPIDEYRLGMFLRRLDEDDQYARVEHEGRTFKQLKASYWNPGASTLLRSPGPVHQIEINVRQQSTETNATNRKDRINGFRIATPELLERHKSGTKDRFKVSAPAWNPQHGILSMQAGRDSGTVGFLDISPQDRKIQAIQLGFDFDFDFHPVCFVATAAGLTEKVRALDRHGALNYGLDSQKTPDELAQFRGIHQRSPFDAMAWSDIVNGVASDLRQHSGLWALKGDRLSGLEVGVGDLATLRIVRGEFEEKLVWDVYLESVNDKLYRKIFS